MTTLPRSDLTDGAATAAEAASPGTSELTRFAPAGSLPDVAAVANAFYATPPSNPMPGPGAALPSAPVFAAEPIYNSLPGVPALQPPLITPWPVYHWRTTTRERISSSRAGSSTA